MKEKSNETKTQKQKYIIPEVYNLDSRELEILIQRFYLWVLTLFTLLSPISCLQNLLNQLNFCLFAKNKVPCVKRITYRSVLTIICEILSLIQRGWHNQRLSNCNGCFHAGIELCTKSLLVKMLYGDQWTSPPTIFLIFNIFLWKKLNSQTWLIYEIFESAFLTISLKMFHIVMKSFFTFIYFFKLQLWYIPWHWSVISQ